MSVAARLCSFDAKRIKAPGLIALESLVSFADVVELVDTQDLKS